MGDNTAQEAGAEVESGRPSGGNTVGDVKSMFK